MPRPSELRYRQFSLRSLLVTAAVVALFAYFPIALFRWRSQVLTAILNSATTAANGSFLDLPEGTVDCERILQQSEFLQQEAISADPSRRATVAFYLVSCPELLTESQELLQVLLRDNEADVRFYVLSMLQRCKPTTAEIYSRIQEMSTSDESEFVRSAAQKVLEKYPRSKVQKYQSPSESTGEDGPRLG
jgi:hypothetical protein